MEKIELLMPAGSLEKLKIAFHYGADAVYAGVPLFSLRARENEISFNDLMQGMDEARNSGKKIYFTANIFARNLKLKAFREQLDQWALLKPDALIMSDPGLIDIVRERHPEIEIHLSVQANCMNWQAVRFWQRLGVRRIILSRELRLTEIKQMKDQVPDMDFEAFVHGSICIAYSGRCLMSHYMSHRDANQGVCDNSCRYPFKVHTKEESIQNEIYLQDMREPEKFYPMEEDEHGTYLMNSKDLCLIEHLKELKEAGVCSFKVEGRTKSIFYAAMVSRIYRKAIDDMESERPFDPQLLNELEYMANRGFHKGFLHGDPGPSAQNYQADNRSVKSHFCGFATETSENMTEIDVRGKICLGDEILVYSPQEKIKTKIVNLWNADRQIKTVLNPGTKGFIQADVQIKKHDFICRV